jgi:hypothetical protein
VSVAAESQSALRAGRPTLPVAPVTVVTCIMFRGQMDELAEMVGRYGFFWGVGNRIVLDYFRAVGCGVRVDCGNKIPNIQIDNCVFDN